MRDFDSPYDQGYVHRPTTIAARLQPLQAIAIVPATVLALAGALMLGFGFRRKTLRWFVLTVVIAVSALAGAAEASVSGRDGTPMTPGYLPIHHLGQFQSDTGCATG